MSSANAWLCVLVFATGPLEDQERVDEEGPECWIAYASLHALGGLSGSLRPRVPAVKSFDSNTTLIRQKREEECSYNEYTCSDGTCVRANSDCNGVYDCGDGSDEAFALCRERKCSVLQFRCSYGACVSKFDVCNRIWDCADGSDELMEQCTRVPLIEGDKFKCRNGQLVNKAGRCDGVADCADGSDETVASCANFNCTKGQFHCAYGGCVDAAAQCNGTVECRDRSDEMLELCGKLQLVRVDLSSTTTEASVSANKCVLPPEPQNGIYRIISETNSSDADYVLLEYACYPRYKLVGESRVLCWRGLWPNIPYCIQTCPLQKDPSIEYQCTEDDMETPRECQDEEVEGTIVKPMCRQPNYYSPVELPYMQCSQGSWSSGPVCAPECGTLTVQITPLVLGGEIAKNGDVPWHAGIYRKSDGPEQYQQICGGSLISNTVVLSAAHCFWSVSEQRVEDESIFAVAVGKLYRDWYNPKDERFAQKTNVSKIVVPKLYRDIELHYHHDIAVVVVTTPFQYKLYVRPVCLDFRQDFNNEQLQSGKLGKAAGWGLTTEYRGSESQELKMIDMPYEDTERCINVTLRPLKHYVVFDKICAGSLEGEALCRGDSGGGLAFPSEISGVERYYLRGVASTSPLLRSDISCNVDSLTTFTSVIKYEDFIKRYLYT
ncbi:modular serine protease-like [Battus philenor]|uniref:modular serine protease-like n=1 Tax=Battus philenor TaxID=42288 RepID=UPI0035D0AEFB